MYQEADGIMIYTQGKDRKEYAEKYIEEIEKNIKELKKNKKQTKEIYTFKQGSLEGYPNLRKIIEDKAISELICR